MASLLTNTKLGNTGVSSLIKSATTLATEQQNYEDQIQALTYANSAYTDEAFSKYQSYLSGRINALRSTGSITDASKALTLTKTLEGAMHSNVSASITRENIQIMAGNATMQDKYNVVVKQYSRAMSNGDLTLAQSLENQAYSLSQTIQQQAQQAADARATLAKATSSSNVTYQGEVVSNLKAGLSYLNGLARNASERELNANLAAYAKQAKPQLQALGVNIKGNQPNYFDVVYGVAGAIYNAQVLKAQAEAPINPLLSRTYATDAANYLNGNSKFQTLAGNLTVQEIQQAQQDPNMFTYDNTTGKYVRDIQSGYQYMTFTDASGKTSQQLVPQYSAFANTASGRKAFNQVEFLSPQETAMMTKLHLNFTENYNNKSVANTSLSPGQSGTTGQGVQVSISQDSPQWLKNILGSKGIANFYTTGMAGENNGTHGFLTFTAGASNGQGKTMYTLGTDSKGLQGLYENLPNGSTQLIGGDYGFDSQAVQLLINKGQQVQYQIQQVQAAQAAKLHMEQLQVQHQLQVRQAQQHALQIAQAQRTAALQKTVNPQRTVAPQLPSYNPQPKTFNPQGNNYNPQGGHGPINPGAIAGSFSL